VEGVGPIVSARKFSHHRRDELHQAAQILPRRNRCVRRVMNASGKLPVISRVTYPDRSPQRTSVRLDEDLGHHGRAKLVAVKAEKTLETACGDGAAPVLFHMIVMDRTGKFRGMMSIQRHLRVVG